MLLSVACASNEQSVCIDEQRFASEVLRSDFGDGQNFGQEDFPSPIFGGPRGGGSSQGSLDVVSLGDGGLVEVGFSGTEIVDGLGPDFIVFENPFLVDGDAESPLAELARVSVSEDGETWHEFPCQPEAFPYTGCAGWHPVLANVEENDVSPFDAEAAGGDAFDLAELGLTRARWVRIVDIAGDDVAFDLDAVSVVNAECSE
ncbi:MAG TPA: hypothetical protein VLC09_08160 [Polyangiaceae bacterium]|nr:hypothetical protein [Polyangiaceae bacterium]